jgi:choline kinase
MKLVILAAGRGERLMPLTQNTPKCLLELANGMTLLECQLLASREVAALEEVVLVLGYLAEQVEAKLERYRQLGMKLSVVYNPFFDVSNNLASLWMALPFLGSEFVVVNGDDVFNPRILQELTLAPQAQEVVMVIDRKERYDAEDMKVQTAAERVTAVSKQIPLDEATGESIGMIRFSGRGAVKLKQVLQRLIRTDVGRKGFWLLAVQAVIDEGLPVFALECSPADWAEIDFHPDRELVRGNLARYGDLVRTWSSAR